MACTDEQKQLFASLVDTMNDLVGLLRKVGEDEMSYKSIGKIKNMAKNNDINGLHKIPKYLDGLYTVMNDNKIYTRSMGLKLDKAYDLYEQLGGEPVA